MESDTKTSTTFSFTPYSEGEIKKTYNQQRKDRLTDCIGDYLTDEDITAEDFYNDFIEEIDGWIKYHQNYLNKCKKVKELVTGNAQ